MKKGRFRLHTRKNFPMMMVVKHLYKLPKVVWKNFSSSGTEREKKNLNKKFELMTNCKLSKQT